LRGAKTVETLYQEGLAKLPKSEREEKLLKRYHERYHWPLALAILLLMGEFLFPDRKRESRIVGTTEAAREVSIAKVPVSAALLVLALALSSTSVLASNSGALRDYKRGQYDKALQEYQSSLQRKSDDPRLQFNTGAAAYRAQKFDEAIKRFSEALNSPDLNLQQSAYYNRGNTLYYAGEQATDPAKRNDLWKKSVQDFDSALKLKADDVDAKFNRDFVKQRLEEAKEQQKQNSPQEKIEPSEEAKKAKQRADEAVIRRAYSEALQIMEAQLAKDPTTKYYDDFITRLREVTGVQSNSKSN
jgi:Ca-activated chloride channel family protein